MTRNIRVRIFVEERKQRDGLGAVQDVDRPHDQGP